MLRNLLYSKNNRLIALLLIITICVALITSLIILNNGESILISLPLLCYIWCISLMLKQESKSANNLNFLIGAIENGDYSFKFPERNGSDFRDLNVYLNKIRTILQEARDHIIEKERFYENVLNRMKSGVLICDDKNFNVYNVNESTLELLGLSRINNLSHLDFIQKGLSDTFKSYAIDSVNKVSYQNERETVNLMIQLTSIKFQQKTLRVYSLSNITSELEDKEIDSWNRLTRVLTHEIMNSLTPIISITQTLIESKKEDNPIVKELEVINSTSRALIEFVSAYRQLSYLPKPIMTLFFVSDIANRVVSLMLTSFPSIKFDITVTPEDLLLYADENQIYQVLINIVKNASQAIISNGITDGQIKITCSTNSYDHIIIGIEDNAPKITKEVEENIFIPFFTTKNEGTGIGLSFARQIMRLHNGTLTLNQKEANKKFILTFK